MIGILFYMSIALGFAFPHFLIKAIKEDNFYSELLTCLFFGIIVLTILLVAGY